jgi:hypothetical protein
MAATSNMTETKAKEDVDNVDSEYEDIKVKVNNFLLMKHVTEEDEKLVLVGKMIQYAFSGFSDGKQIDNIEFGYRFNDSKIE